MYTSVCSDTQGGIQGQDLHTATVIFQGTKGKTQAGGPTLVTGYWESLLWQLHEHMAHTGFQKPHQDLLWPKLYKLKQEQGMHNGLLVPHPQAEATVPQLQPGASGASRALSGGQPQGG